jgi:hypothetical protein
VGGGRKIPFSVVSRACTRLLIQLGDKSPIDRL